MGSFILYSDWEEHLLHLSMEQRGALLSAMFAYHNRGETPAEADPVVIMAFSFIRTAMDQNKEKRARTSQARAWAGRLGGLAKAGKADMAESAPVSESVPVSEPDSGSDSGSGQKAGPPKAARCADKPRFTPPTLEQVCAYVEERGSRVDPQGFLDFYAAKGWRMGSASMEDWKAACRNAERWERWEKKTERGRFADLAQRMEQEGLA